MRNLNFLYMEISKEAVVSKDSGCVEERVSTQTSIPCDPYANVERLLSEADMSAPAVQKLLLNENDRKAREIDKLRMIEEQYHKRDKDAAILEEKLKKSTFSDILYTLCETGGSALAGVSGIFWENKGWIFLVIGFVFIIGGIVFKFAER